MKNQAIIGKRYARALFQAALERQAVEQVRGDLVSAAQTIRDQQEFQTILAHPNIAKDVKLDLLHKAFAGKVHELVLNALHLIVRKGRFSALPGIVESYVGFADEALNRIRATVYSAVALSDRDAREIASRFSELLGKTVDVETIVDPELLGGIRVQIGDLIYDGSLSGKLQRLEQTLTRKAM